MIGPGDNNFYEDAAFAGRHEFQARAVVGDEIGIGDQNPLTRRGERK